MIHSSVPTHKQTYWSVIGFDLTNVKFDSLTVCVFLPLNQLIEFFTLCLHLLILTVISFKVKGKKKYIYIYVYMYIYYLPHNHCTK